MWEAGSSHFGQEKPCFFESFRFRVFRIVFGVTAHLSFQRIVICHEESTSYSDKRKVDNWGLSEIANNIQCFRFLEQMRLPFFAAGDYTTLQSEREGYVYKLV